MIEYNQTDSTMPFIEMDNHLHIEHILPKKWEEYPEWKKYITPEIAKDYLHSIGNLTLLSGKKNIEASNNPFDTKISIYEGKGKHKDNDNKITSFSITQRIYNDYKRGEVKWDEKAMKDRQDWFLDEVNKVLKL